MTEEEYFYEAIPDVYEEFKRAIYKHPVFAHQGPPSQVVMEELGEACSALNDGDYRHAVIEIDHTIVTLLRWRKQIQSSC